MFKSLIVLSSLGIYVTNPIQSLLWLVIVFILAGYILLEMGAEFIAILLILVYVGAIAVLFLFVIMLLNIRKVELNNYYLNYLPLFIFVCFFFFLELIFFLFLKNNFLIFSKSFFSVDFFWIKNLYYTSNVEVMGFLLFDVYYYYFFFLSFILLIALFGVIILLVNKVINDVDFDNLYKKKLKITHQLMKNINKKIYIWKYY